MAIEELSELNIAELFDYAFKLIAMIRLGKARAEDIDTLWEILTNIQYEVTRRCRQIEALMN